MEIAFVVVDAHLPLFEVLGYVLPHFDALTHVCPRRSSFKRLLRSAILSS